MMLLEGKVAIVSGVGPGLGRAAALALAEQGADIVLGARTREKLEVIAREVEGRGRKTLIVPTDITKPEQAKNMADTAFGHFGRIDILVNNAGWSGPYAHVVDVDVEEWRATVDGNLVGTMCMCKYTAPYMIQAKRGAIVNVTSRIMRQGMQRRSAYSAAKAGVTLFSQSLADELGPQGIRVNCVVPGHIWSENLKGFYEKRAAMLGKTYDEVYAMYTDMMALRRIPRPEEIAKAIVFLASDWASAITGQSLDVNSGHFFH